MDRNGCTCATRDPFATEHRELCPLRESPEEKAQRIGVPVLQPRRRLPVDPNPTVAVCGECGIELKRIMGLACMNERCPIRSADMQRAHTKELSAAIGAFMTAEGALQQAIANVEAERDAARERLDRVVLAIGRAQLMAKPLDADGIGTSAIVPMEAWRELHAAAEAAREKGGM